MKKSEVTKKVGISLLIALVVSIAASFITTGDSYKGIQEKVLRMHVLANSDSEEDQQLKLRVRDRLLKECETLFNGAEDEQEAADIVRQNSKSLTSAAQEVVTNAGYDYPVSLEVADTYFDARQYDNITLPAGEYEAVRVVIGEGDGRNWWCVMFPPMCVPAAEGDDVDTDAKQLDDVLNAKELDIVENPEKYEIRLKSLEIAESIGNWFKDLLSV